LSEKRQPVGMKLVLATLQSRYSHASLALPSLAAACSGISGLSCVIREWTVHEHHDRLLRRLVAESANLYGFSCYIWNMEQTLRLVADLKQILPDAVMVLGGPESSFGTFELMVAHPAVDCVVRGEGEESFRELAELVVACGALPQEELLTEIPGIACRVDGEIIATLDRPPVSSLDRFPSPFHAGLVDLTKPLVYVETSRGCPFSCAFCLSSLDRTVRSYGSERLRADLSLLMAAEVATVKLVDRTFNYDPRRASEIWEFILQHNRTSLFHFEIAAELLTEDNFRVLRSAPPGIFRFEIGVQAGEKATLERVGRNSDPEKILGMVRRLREETGVIVHLDLVAGLPGEGYDGFLASLERLLVARPHHIQVEPLKVLKGAPMRRIAAEEGYLYAASPPYKVLQTPWLSFEEIARIEDLSRLLDLMANSGRFSCLLTVLEQEGPLSSFFDGGARLMAAMEGEPRSFLDLSDLVQRFLHTLYGESPLLSDALSFDFCRAEYPSLTRLPVCFGDVTGAREARGPNPRQTAAIPVGARVRRFRRRFLRNYLETPWEEEPTELLFTYVARQGEGERVIVEKYR
jgi:anaerobic magnesium-protoporphyrin IX monomethyl ester cyclase